MPDISMCTSIKGDRQCPVRETCYRYMATPCEFRQSWFTEAPFIPDTEGQTCGYYWRLAQTEGDSRDG